MTHRPSHNHNGLRALNWHNEAPRRSARAASGLHDVLDDSGGVGGKRHSGGPQPAADADRIEGKR